MSLRLPGFEKAASRELIYYCMCRSACRCNQWPTFLIFSWSVMVFRKLRGRGIPLTCFPTCNIWKVTKPKNQQLMEHLDQGNNYTADKQNINDQSWCCVTLLEATKHIRLLLTINKPLTLHKLHTGLQQGVLTHSWKWMHHYFVEANSIIMILQEPTFGFHSL